MYDYYKLYLCYGIEKLHTKKEISDDTLIIMSLKKSFVDIIPIWHPTTKINMCATDLSKMFFQI